MSIQHAPAHPASEISVSCGSDENNVIREGVLIPPHPSIRSDLSCKGWNGQNPSEIGEMHVREFGTDHERQRRLRSNVGK